jgi:hypothetical protein
MAAVAAAAFASITAAAQADPMAPGTWQGQITGGTLALGDGDYHTTPIAVPAGAKFTFTIPGSGGPVAWTAPATHIDVPVRSVTEGTTQYSAGGTIDISPVTGSVEPSTGAATGTAATHGVFHFNSFDPGGSSSIYCYFGNPAAPASAPAPPAPAPLNLAGTGDLVAVFGAVVECGDAIPPVDHLRILGHLSMPSNTLTVNMAFTHLSDPPATNTGQNTTSTTTTTTTQTVTPVQCVVPKLTGLKLAKARTAATKAHCAVGKVKRKKSARKATTVLKQGAKTGAVLAEGSKIALTVAK